MSVGLPLRPDVIAVDNVALYDFLQLHTSLNNFRKYLPQHQSPIFDRPLLLHWGLGVV